MTEKPKRYILTSVIRQLRAIARDRCCLQGHLISTDEILERIESETLHMHHIIYFSEGGENVEENLMLVCPTCHAKTHRSPDKYPIEKLMEAKRHWTAMTKLVPMDLEYETEDRSFFSKESIVLPYVVETFNLSYRIKVPRSISVLDLGRYIGNWILRPLAFYTRTAPYPSILAKSRIGHVDLALQSNPDAILPRNLLIETLEIADGDALIALTDVHMVHAMMKEIKEEEESLIFERVTLRWGEEPRDLDLHFLIQQGDSSERIWYQNLGTLKEFPWARLNGDVTTGRGPEILSFGLLAKGRYTVVVHNFSNETPLASSNATIDLELRGESRTFRCPHEGSGRLWLVFELNVASGELKEINTLTDNLDNLTGGFRGPLVPRDL